MCRPEGKKNNLVVRSLGDVTFKYSTKPVVSPVSPKSVLDKLPRRTKKVILTWLDLNLIKHDFGAKTKTVENIIDTINLPTEVENLR